MGGLLGGEVHKQKEGLFIGWVENKVIIVISELLDKA